MLFDAGLSSLLTAGGTDKRVLIPLRITCGDRSPVGPLPLQLVDDNMTITYLIVY